MKGYVPKTLPLRSLTSALRLVLSGQVFLPMSLLSEADGSTGFDQRGDSQKLLTPKEVNILRLVSDGKTNKEIADILLVSKNTILFHRYNIRDKLGLKNQKVNLRSHLLTLE